MYKIKFLEKIDTGKKGNQVNRKSMTVSLGEADLNNMAAHWKGMGFVEIEDIECFKGASKSQIEIVNLFYSKDHIVDGKKITVEMDDDDFKIKEALVAKFSKSKNKSEEIPEQVPKEIQTMNPDEEKALRKKIFNEFKARNIKVPFNLKTETLIAKARENNVEI